MLLEQKAHRLPHHAGTLYANRAPEGAGQDAVGDGQLILLATEVPSSKKSLSFR
jgi:hypothetical protein